MDKKKLLAMGTAVVGLSSIAAQDADAVTKNISINAVVLQAIALAEIQSLNFGSMTVGATGDTVTIDTAGARAVGGGGTVTLVTGNAAEQEAKLKITAANGINMDVKVTTVPATITNGNANTMKVTAFDVNGAGGATAVVAVTAGTNRTIPIGGTLTVGNNQQPGTYTGTFTVDVQYQ